MLLGVNITLSIRRAVTWQSAKFPVWQSGGPRYFTPVSAHFSHLFARVFHRHFERLACALQSDDRRLNPDVAGASILSGLFQFLFTAGEFLAQRAQRVGHVRTVAVLSRLF